MHHKQPVVFPEMGVPPILLISCFAAWGVAANMTDPLGIWIGIAVARMPTAGKRRPTVRGRSISAPRSSGWSAIGLPLRPRRADDSILQS